MHDRASITISPVRTPDDLASAVKLFREYAAALEIDLSYQNFEAELAAMPGQYAPPAGELLLARDAKGSPLGCVAVRPLDADGCCEMKRLYVSPQARGIGLGRRLVEAILREAERIGYREIRLDTLPSMAGALALYRSTEFDPMEPYYDTPWSARSSCAAHSHNQTDTQGIHRPFDRSRSLSLAEGRRSLYRWISRAAWFRSKRRATQTEDFEAVVERRWATTGAPSGKQDERETVSNNVSRERSQSRSRWRSWL